MNNLRLSATPLTPSIEFDYDQHRLEIRGESYPENVLAFYAPILASLRSYLMDAAQTKATVEVVLQLTYINSASTRSFQQLLSLLNVAAKEGAAIRVHWHVDPDDDALTELGQDLLADKDWLHYEIVPLTPAAVPCS